MAAATTTGKAVRQRLVERGWLFLGKQTGTGVDSSTITDTTRLQSVTLPSSKFDGSIVRIASGNAQGDQTYVDRLIQDVGQLKVSPALSGALANGDSYEVWLKGIDPDMVDRLRDEAARRVCSMWRIQPLCIIDDGDLDASTVTAWTAVGAATRTKTFAAFPNTHGRRQLVVTHTTASTDYVESNPVDVLPGERFFFECPVSAYITSSNAPATARVEVFDVTNNSIIPLGGFRTSHTGKGFGYISLLFNIPSGCSQIRFRLRSDTNASTTVWGPMNCTKRSKSMVALPDRITTVKRVGTTFRLSDPNTSTSDVSNQRYKLREYANVERTRIGPRVVLWFNPPLENTPVWYHERGYYEALQTDYFTPAGRVVGDNGITDCPEDYLVAATASLVAKHMLSMDETNAFWQAEWVRAEAELNYWEQEFGPEPQFIEENESPVYVPQLSI